MKQVKDNDYLEFRYVIAEEGFIEEAIQAH